MESVIPTSSYGGDMMQDYLKDGGAVKGLADNLRDIVSNYFSEYRRALEDDRKAALESLNTGDVVPGVGRRLVRDESVRRMNAAGAKARADAAALLDNYERIVQASMSEAPTDEALRAIQAAAAVRGLTENEIASLRERYGGNYLCSRMISQIAADNHIYAATTNTTEKMAEAFAGVRRALERMQPANIEHGETSLDFNEWAVLDSIGALNEA